MKKNKITQQRLKELLKYNSATGEFIWRVQKSGASKLGGIAGHINRYGYRKVCLDGKIYHASNLAWLYVFGEIPIEQIDHINRDRSDDKIDNLRLASRSENLRNSKLRVDNFSGYKGVYQEGNKWSGQIRFNKKLIRVGTFASKEEAARAVISAQIKLDPVFYG